MLTEEQVRSELENITKETVHMETESDVYNSQTKDFGERILKFAKSFDLVKDLGALLSCLTSISIRSKVAEGRYSNKFEYLRRKIDYDIRPALITEALVQRHNRRITKPLLGLV